MTGSPVPKSLIKRGISVPFTSRLIRHAWIRNGSSGVEFLLPDLGDGHGRYILPAEGLQSLKGFTAFDYALFARLAERPTIRPHMVARDAAEIAETGLGGAQPMRQCKAYLRDLNQEGANLTITLIQKAVAQLAEAGDNARNLDRAGLTKPEGLMAARTALAGFAKTAKTSQDQIFQRLEDWAKLLVPLGLGDRPYDYSVKATLAQMDAVAADLKQWLISEPVEPAELAQRTALAMQYTANLGWDVLAEQEAMVQDMARTLTNWEEIRKEILDRSETLQYLVSGWQGFVGSWLSRENRERFSQRETLQDRAPFLPLLPPDLVKPHDEFWTQLRNLQPEWAARGQLVQRMDHTAVSSLERFRREAS